MKIFRTTIIAFGILLALIVLTLIFYPLKQKGIQKEKEKLQVLLLDPKQIDSFTIDRKFDSLTISRLDKPKDGRNWQLTKPLIYPVNEKEINSIVELLSHLKAQRWVTDTPSDLTAYGLKIPKTKIRIIGKNFKKEIWIGKKLHKRFENYVKLKESPSVYVIHASISNRLNQGLRNFRERRIFQFEPTDVVQLQIKSSQYDWLAKKSSEEEWIILTNGKEYPAENKTLMGLILGSQNLHVDEFSADYISPEDLKEFSLEPPEIEFYVKTSSGKEHGLLISKELTHENRGSWIYAIKPKDQFIFGLESRYLNRFRKNPKTFFKKS